MSDFQTAVNSNLARAVEGDFASANMNKYTALAGPRGIVSGPSGLTQGRFAWCDFTQADGDGAPAIANNFGFGPVAGFVRRDQQALITTFLASASMVMPAGFPVTIFEEGDFWAKNTGSNIATPGMKAFANLLTGAVSFAATGTIAGGASGATASIAKTTLTLVGGIADNVLTVATISAGSVYPGSVLSSNAVGTVVKQLTNASGAITAANPADYSVGTYLLDTGGQTVATGTTIGGFYGLLSTGTVTGTFVPGMVLSGTGVPANDMILLLVSGTGGTTSTMVVSNVATVSSATIVGSTVVETKWYARSVGAANELVKMSSTAQG